MAHTAPTPAFVKHHTQIGKGTILTIDVHVRYMLRDIMKSTLEHH
jgi:hypothetical protein